MGKLKSSTVGTGAEVQALGARGDGVTGDGRFVPGAVPGDRLLPDGTVQPGPNRVTPPCRHFGICGGCQIQHAGEAVLAEFARERCLRPLAALGITPRETMPVHLSPPGTRRRATLRAARKAGGVHLGYSRQGAHELVDLVE
ncbi:MAG: class I SAM-dependent RNA methyltransferase, partial [Thermaurantiacus sp.]